jgi:hypothetical protein
MTGHIIIENYHPTSQVSASVTMVITNCRKLKEVFGATYNGMIFIPSFIKICFDILKSKVYDQTSHALISPEVIMSPYKTKFNDMVTDKRCPASQHLSTCHVITDCGNLSTDRRKCSSL